MDSFEVQQMVSETYSVHDAAMDFARCGMVSYTEAYTAIERVICTEKYSNSVRDFTVFMEKFRYWKKRLRHV